jgi:Transposase
LIIAMLLTRQQRVLYLPGVAVNRASAAYRGEGKTDPKDATIIADQARMRHDPRTAGQRTANAWVQCSRAST